MSFRPKKRLGQHFLIDQNVIRKIVDAVAAPPQARVVEIGPGMGALTGLLLERHPNLTVVEVDEEAVAHLREQFPDLDIRHEDVLGVDWSTFVGDHEGHPYGDHAGYPYGDSGAYVVGNLPYYITSPILFGLLDARRHIRRAVLMTQKEVAERIVAEPGSKAYGILSVQTQLLARPRMLFSVSRHVFRPKPDVESAVISLDFDMTGEVSFDVTQMRRVVRTAFGQRRKMLRKSLSGLCAELHTSIPDEFATRRPEALSPEEFVKLTNTLFKVDL